MTNRANLWRTRLPFKKSRQLQALVIVGVFAVAGFGIILTRAATPNIFTEAESGTLAGAATVVADDAASGSSAVQFGGGSTVPAVPGQLLNLKNWYLGLPTGSDSADSVYQPELDTYSSEYFQLNDAKDGVVFMAPVEGSTTGNSSHTRSELRETSQQGTLPWGWPAGSGRHVMTATESIDHLPGGNGKLSFAQIHGPGSVWYLILMATGTGDGTAKLTVKDETGEADGQVIVENYQLGAKFNLVVSAIDGKVTISYNGTEVVSTTSGMDDSYFKIGSYNQSEGDYSQVTVYSLTVEHE